MNKVRAKLHSVLLSKRRREKEASQGRPQPDELGKGAMLPPELFPQILKWVSRNDTRRETFDRLSVEASQSRKKFDRRRFQLEVEKAGPAYTLRSCSLVCVYWANRCREYVWRDARFHVGSLEKAECFRKYSVEGCRSLIPIYTLIRSVTVTMFCDSSSRSYLDLVYMPRTNRIQLREVKIIGPLPMDVPPPKRDSPHWGLTNLSTPPLTVTAYEQVVIKDVMFPSFNHLVKYFKYFNAAERYYLTGLTWDGKTPNNFAQFFKPATRRRKYIEIHASGCTDNLIVCLQIATMYPDFPLRAIASQDYAWAMQLMDIVGDLYRKVPRGLEKGDEAIKYTIRGSVSPLEHEHHMFNLNISHALPSHVDVYLEFYSEVKSSPTSSIESGRTPPIRTRITALTVTLSSPRALASKDMPQLSIFDLGLMVKSMQRHPPLRGVVLAFESYDLLKECATRFPTLLNPMGEKNYMPVFPYEGLQFPGLSVNFVVGNWVEVDRSCKPTGKQWSNMRAILDDALNIHK